MGYELPASSVVVADLLTSQTCGITSPQSSLTLYATQLQRRTYRLFHAISGSITPYLLGAPRSTCVGRCWFCAMSEDVLAPGVTSLLLKRPVMTSCEGSRKRMYTRVA